MLEAYIRKFSEAAQESGLEHLSFHVERSSSRSVEICGGELEKLELSDSCRLVVEGAAEGFAGSVFIEDLQPERVEEHVRTLRETALECRRPFTP